MLIAQPHAEVVPVDPLRVPSGLYHQLFEAYRFLTSDLSLPDVHRRLVVAACDLVGAPDGALAIRGYDGGVEHVVSYGAGRKLVDGAGPGADDVAGMAVADGGVAQRVVAIDVRGVCYATLHVAAGGDDTDVADLALLHEFAEAAGAAIDNARRYDEARRSRDWLNASGEIARALLADADADTLLDVVSRALHVAEADLGSLILPTEDGRMRVAISVGLGADNWQGRLFEAGHSALGRAIVRGESLLVPDLMPLAADDFENEHRYGPTMMAPLIDAKGIRGAVVLIRRTGRTGFTPHELDLATTFANQVALALELNDMRADTEALRALRDRHRIAQDLHDNVIQRLFATGVGLQGVAAGQQLPVAAVDRLRRHIADLDETIDEIRDTVFGLRNGAPADVVREPTRFPRLPVEPGSCPRPPGG
jgi:signal transduction histidine kinase